MDRDELIARLRGLECTMVEVCEPHPANPSPNIFPVAREDLLAALESRPAPTEVYLAAAVRTIMARCEALEDEAADNLPGAKGEHEQLERGYWRGQKSTAKALRRELHDLSRDALATETQPVAGGEQ